MPYRVLIAKPGLDGHDRGAKLVAYALREAGFEVVYTGIRQRPATIAVIAAEEDVDLVGLSILSGAHLALTEKICGAMADAGVGDTPVVLGGTIPAGDVERLIELGAAAVYPTGSTLEVLVQGVTTLCVRNGALRSGAA